MNREPETELYYREVMDNLDRDPDYLNRSLATGEFLLHSAVMDDQEEVLRALLQRGVNVNTVDHSRRTALHEAAKGGFPHLVALLLENGAEAECQDMAGMTPLLYAALFPSDHRDQVVAALLTKATLDLNSMILLGECRRACEAIQTTPAMVQQTPFPNDLLNAAVQHGDMRLVELLLDHGVDVNGTAKWTRLPPLITACQSKTVNSELIRLLLPTFRHYGEAIISQLFSWLQPIQ